MTHGSLFSGIGGFDLAAEWMGWQNVFHCEWNIFGQRVLKHYWPDAISYHDITKTDFTIHRGRIDILTGGFPCQPYSTAGKRLGKEDDRHLWPSMLRAIREIQPRWVVGENVLGLVNWSGGLVFHEVQADLEAEGYEVQPFVLPAVSVNAPHRRDRVWFVAYSNSCRIQESILQHTNISTRSIRDNKQTSQNTISDGCLRGEPIEEGAELRQQRDIGARDTERVCGEEMAGIAAYAKGNGSTSSKLGESESRQQIQTGGNVDGFEGLGDATDPDTKECIGGSSNSERERETAEQGGDGIFGSTARLGKIGDASDTGDTGLQRSKIIGGTGSVREDRDKFFAGRIPSNWEKFPTVSPICDGDDGISDRLDGITFSKWRQESIKAGGNAVVPQVVLQIFRTIEEYEKMNTQ